MPKIPVGEWCMFSPCTSNYFELRRVISWCLLLKILFSFFFSCDCVMHHASVNDLWQEGAIDWTARAERLGVEPASCSRRIGWTSSSFSNIMWVLRLQNIHSASQDRFLKIFYIIYFILFYFILLWNILTIYFHVFFTFCDFVSLWFSLEGYWVYII